MNDTPVSISLSLGHTAAPRLPRVREPIIVGIPMPRGACSSTDRWRLASSDGVPLALQARILDRWGDGSIRWALLDFQASVPAGDTATVVLHLEGQPDSPAAPAVSTTASGGVVTVETGVAQFRLDRHAPFIFAEASSGNRPIVDGSRCGLRILSDDGARCEIRWTELVVEEEGAVRSTVRVKGEARGPGFRLDLVLRLHFHAGSPVVRLLVTVRNPRRAAHPGGIWELGDRGSVLLQEMAVVLARPESSRAELLSCSAEAGQPLTDCREHLEVYQDSSGGENWQSPNHVNRHGVVPHRFRGYRTESDGNATTGLRAAPIVLTQGAGATLGVAVPHFWQNFPRAIEATPDSLTVGLFPRQFDDVHELQGGEQKTHACYLLFGRDTITNLPLDWCRSPLVAHASPEWYACTDAVPYVTPSATDTHTDYLALVDAAIDGDDSFERKRERVDEYGWRNFGDIYADHEGVYAPAGTRFVSHYNNQYDAAAGFAIHFLRSGDLRWWRAMDELARHVTDIDVYHTDEDKSALNHGLFWHTYHYVHAGKSTHRSYPRTKKVYGGGPSAEHDYSSGLMLHYFLTGSEQSRDAVLELAQWVLDFDDGRKTLLRWLDRGPTGVASATGAWSYHGPGRAPGNSIATLLNAHTLTNDPRYLAKAEELIRRCIHPADDITALNLLDAERRWYYNVFLQVLGRYLWFKSERGQCDTMYGYAQAALLHYARWMADHEYPYLERPEILEYPNETWPAQDLRKSEVFMHAALHAQAQERARFEERARFFFDCSVLTLVSTPSHTLARPTVLALVTGYMRDWFDGRSEFSMPKPRRSVLDFGRPQIFVPQRYRALRRAMVLGAGVVLLVIALVIAIVLSN